MDDLEDVCVVHRLGEICNALKCMTSIHLVWVITRGQDNDRDVPGACIGLEAFEELETVKTGEVQVEQDHFWRWMLRAGVFMFSQDVIESLLPIVKHDEIVGDLRPVQVLFNEPGVSGVVFDHQDRLELTLYHVTMTFSCGHQVRLVHPPLTNKFPRYHIYSKERASSKERARL